MTIDPNDAPQAELPLEAAPEALAPEPEPQAPPAGATAEEVANLVIEKLMSAANTNAPEAQTQAYHQAQGGDVISTLRAQASDPNHPLFANAVAQLETLRSQGEEQEWAALGCPIGHGARQLYGQNPAAFSGRPRHAFTAWQLQEARSGQAANNDAARLKAAEEKEKEAAKAVRDSAPGMPSRSVAPTPRAGKDVYDTVEDYRRAAASDPTLDDRYDRGEITIRTI